MSNLMNYFTFFLLLLIIPAIGAQPVSQTQSSTNVSLEYQQALLKLQQNQLRLQQQLLQVKQQEAWLKKYQTDFSQAKKLLQLSWRKAEKKKVPKQAFIAGYAFGAPLHFCQVVYGADIQPGQQTATGCLISYAGTAEVLPDYRILTAKIALFWKPFYYMQRYSHPFSRSSFSSTHQYGLLPVVGGHERGHDINLCRGIYHNRIHLGKVVSGACNIASENKEIALHVFEVLFKKNSFASMP